MDLVPGSTTEGESAQIKPQQEKTLPDNFEINQKLDQKCEKKLWKMWAACWQLMYVIYSRNLPKI